jgi:hypothetical protein
MPAYNDSQFKPPAPIANVGLRHPDRVESLAEEKQTPSRFLRRRPASMPELVRREDADEVNGCKRSSRDMFLQCLRSRDGWSSLRTRAGSWRARACFVEGVCR